MLTCVLFLIEPLWLNTGTSLQQCNDVLLSVIERELKITFGSTTAWSKFDLLYNNNTSSKHCIQSSNVRRNTSVGYLISFCTTFQHKKCWPAITIPHAKSHLHERGLESPLFHRYLVETVPDQLLPLSKMGQALCNPSSLIGCMSS